VVYTGTHDNDTTLGWLKKLEGEEKKTARCYLGRFRRRALKNCIEMAWGSCAKMAVIPMQDVLRLGSKSRMNTPGTANGNWGWRFRWSQLKKKHVKFLDELTGKYNR
jgi:4-alpha-glucanotransferase